MGRNRIKMSIQAAYNIFLPTASTVGLKWVIPGFLFTYTLPPGMTENGASITFYARKALADTTILIWREKL